MISGPTEVADAVGEEIQWGEKNGVILKRMYFFWSGKIAYEGAFQNLLRSCFFIGGRLNSSNKEKMER